MLSLIKKSEKVPDYIEFINHNTEHYEIIPKYEQAKLLILDNFLPIPWLEWIWTYTDVLTSDILRLKKAKAADLANEKFLLNFTKQPAKLGSKINELYQWIINFTLAKFRGYQVQSENWTWRLTETLKDAMHLDSYAGQNNDLHNLRIFVNLDSDYRTWRTSYSVEDILEYYKSKALHVPNKHPNEINDILNSYIACDALPYHEIKFAPGTLWMVNTQIISHQGWYGRRMAAYTFRCDPVMVNDSSLNFVNRVQNKIKELHE